MIMLKKSLMTAAVATMLGAQAQASVKIGVVNMQTAIRSVKRGKAAQAKLEKELGADRAKLDKDQEKFQKDAEAFQTKVSANAISEKARAEQGAALQKRMAEIQQRGQKFEYDVRRRQSEAIEPIVKGLREAATTVGAKRKMDLVIDDTGEAVLYADDKTDLTEELIKVYDEKNP